MERRRQARVAFSGRVELEFRRGRCVAHARDLSPEGIGLQLASALPAPRTALTSEFTLPGISLPLALESVVVWSDARHGLLGLRFDGIDPGLADLLANYVRGRL